MLDGTHVLIVEDEPLAGMDLSAMVVEANGHVIGPVRTVTEARQLIRTAAIDVALLDLSLADGEVTPVLEALRAEDVPLVVYTGGEVPDQVKQRHPDLRIVQKPALPARIIGEVLKARKIGRRPYAIPNV